MCTYLHMNNFQRRCKHALYRLAGGSGGKKKAKAACSALLPLMRTKDQERSREMVGVEVGRAG